MAARGRRILASLSCALAVTCLGARSAAADVVVRIYLLAPAGLGETIGTVHLSDAKGGLRLAARLKDLSAGPHGFHLRATGACGAASASAAKTAAHGAATAAMAERDLPPLVVGGDGVARGTVLAQGLKLADIHGGMLVIDGADEHARPGAGASAAACGVIPQ